MIYSIENKDNLPNIRELVEFIEKKASELPIRHILPIEQGIQDNSCFVVTRTGSGRTTFKPNITNQACLFAGRPDFQNIVKSKTFTKGQPNFLLDNVRREEFDLVMESHPFYQLLKNGIEIPNYRPLVIENPYGLALSYGFPTQLQPLTSCLNIAAYWAVSQEQVDGRRTLIDSTECLSGMLYMFILPVQMGMISGLSCIGKQAFVRPGLQKMFALHLPQGANFNVHPFVRGFEFKHDYDADSYYFNKYQNEYSLFPANDPLAQKARMIVEANHVSNSAIDRNMKNNPHDNRDINIAKLHQAGIDVRGELSEYLFTEEELADYYAHSHQIWTDFCSDIVFNENNGNDLKKELLKVSTTPQYRKYFEKEVMI